jgi:NAD(P)-dependent dehydrogenase (short-subunit alcohol dehydrogenase family)
MTEIDFRGRVAIVTGAGGGLGRTYAIDMAARGASVVVNDLGGSYDGHGASRTMADSVVAEIVAAGGRAVASHDSISTSDGGKRVVELATDTFGRLDVLINNAGILRNAAMMNVPDEDIDALIDVHLKGAFYVTRPALRAMASSGYGRIVFTSSGSGVYGCPEQAAYGAAKTGLIGLMNVVALEGADKGILANAVLPVAAVTRMAGGGSYTEAQLALYKRLFDPFGAAVTPDFVTPLVVYLASSSCTTNKSMFSASAGRFARVFIGTAEGWFGPRDAPARAEDIAAHLHEIVDAGRFNEVADLLDEAALIGKHIKGAS